MTNPASELLSLIRESAQRAQRATPYFVFDVESVGLHGDAYAVGWVVIEDGKEVDQGCLAVDPDTVNGADSDREWIRANIPPIEVNCKYPDLLRCKFWEAWLKWKAKEAVMVSDCGWPVEANFLSWCIQWDDEARRWDGPYPLHDIASLALANGADPLQTYDRLESELPKHNPLCDARQSARILMDLLSCPRLTEALEELIEAIDSSSYDKWNPSWQDAALSRALVIVKGEK